MAEYNPTIVLSSPMQIVGAFLEIIRERFKFSNDLHWVWDPDYIVGTDTDNKPILIEAMYVKNNEARDFRPAIFVGRDTLPYGETVVGDTANITFQTGTRTNLSLTATNVRFLVEAQSLGEAEAIAHIVASHIHTAKDVLVKQVSNWRHVGPVTLMAPTISRKDVRYIAIPINVGLDFQLTWNVTPIAPKIGEIALKLQDIDDPDGDYHLNKSFYRRYDEDDI